MPLFWKPYKSDVTQFLEELKSVDPTIEAKQRQGRAIWWDKDIDREALREQQAAKVSQQAYVYQTKATP